MNHTDPTPQFTVWSVLGPDGVTHGYYTHLDDQGDTPGARTGSIDCWQKTEPVSPEYSWQPVDGGWELLAGGYWTGVYLIEHTVHGRVEQPAAVSGRVLRDRIASALAARFSDGDVTQGMRAADGDPSAPGWRHVRPREAADAVLGVLAADNRAVARPTTLDAIARHLEARAVSIFRPDSDAYTEYHAVADRLRRLAAETRQTEPPCCSDPTCVCIQVNAEGRCECAKWESGPQVGETRQTETGTPSLTVDELAHALDNSTPYPVELHGDLCRFMAERLREMATVHKRPEHPVWQPEEEPPAPQPEPIDPATLQDRLRCPACGKDVTDYDMGDHVYREGDERAYCSTECAAAPVPVEAAADGKETAE